eukprot:1488215-Rhodomonas_salina.4
MECRIVTREGGATLPTMTTITRRSVSGSPTPENLASAGTVTAGSTAASESLRRGPGPAVSASVARPRLSEFPTHKLTGTHCQAPPACHGPGGMNRDFKLSDSGSDHDDHVSLMSQCDRDSAWLALRLAGPPRRAGAASESPPEVDGLGGRPRGSASFGRGLDDSEDGRASAGAAAAS